MALDATVGASTSNSYGTQAEATTYFAAGMHPDTATWVALSSNGMDEFLILSTLIIEMQGLDGVKNDTTLDGSGVPNQALHFPTTENVDAGAEYVPVKIKYAQFEIAINMALTGTSSTRTDLQSQGVTSIKLADVTETYGGSFSATELPLRASIMLRPFIRMTGGA